MVCSKIQYYTKQTTGIYIKTECSGIDLYYYVEITVQK